MVFYGGCVNNVYACIQAWKCKLTPLLVICKSMEHSYICYVRMCRGLHISDPSQLCWQIILSASVDSPIAHSDLGCCGWWWQGWGEEFVASCFLSFRPLHVVYFLFLVHSCCPHEVLFSSDKHLHSLFYLHDREPFIRETFHIIVHTSPMMFHIIIQDNT